MLTIFWDPQSMPFSIALAVVAGLFALEVLSSVLGFTVLGLGSEAPDLDVDADFDLSGEIDINVPDWELGMPDVDTPDLETPVTANPSGILGWLGVLDVPFLIWLVSFLTMFGLAGLIVQSVSNSLFGAAMPASIACILALLPAFGVTRVIANWVALIMPKTETTALRTRRLGGHRGTITQGTARRGKPAEAKIKDHHGNIHYLRVEPLEDDAEFEQGTDVIVIRKRGDRLFVI